MTQEMKFVTGEFRTFRSQRDIHLGKLKSYLPKDTDVQFDGTVVRFGGQEHTMPEFRSVMRLGWVVPQDSNVGDFVPVPAGVKVRPANPSSTRTREEAMPTVSDEQWEVSRMKGAEIKAPPPKKFNPELVRENVGDHRVVAQTRTPARVEAVLQDPAAQDSKVVGGRFRTATQSTLRVDGSTDQALPPEGVRGEPVAPDSELANEGARVVARLRVTPAPGAEVLDSEPEAVPAGTSHTAAPKEDASSENPATRAAKAAQQRRLQAEQSRLKAEAELPPQVPEKPESPPVTVTQVEEVVELSSPVPPSATRVPPGDRNDDSEEIAPGLVWDRKVHWASRVKRAVELYGEQPDKIDAICAAEAEAVSKGIRKALSTRAVPA